MLAMGATTGPEPWPLPPNPTGIDPKYRDDGRVVCLPRDDFGAMLDYIVDLRQRAMDHGAVTPE